MLAVIDVNDGTYLGLCFVAAAVEVPISTGFICLHVGHYIAQKATNMFSVLLYAQQLESQS